MEKKPYKRETLRFGEKINTERTKYIMNSASNIMDP